MVIPLLTPAYFSGEYLIQGIHGTSDASIANAFHLQMFIAEYEEEYLRRLLGDSFYDEFAAGIAANTAKWIALKDKIYTLKTYNGTTPVSYTDISSDRTFADAVPAGYILEYVVINNRTGNQAQLTMTADNLTGSVFDSWGINPNGLTSIPVGKSMSMDAISNLYLNDSGAGDDWNGVNLDVYLVMSPLTVSNPAPSGVEATMFFSPAAGYVYFHHQRNAVTQTGVSGESIANHENATSALNTFKMVRAWNKMVNQSNKIRVWVAENSTDYPTYSCNYSDSLQLINTLGV